MFHTVLQEAVREFPEVLGAARLPERANAFKREYGEALARFEAARTTSARRVDIARYIVTRTQQALEHVEGDRRLPLAEHMQAPAEASRLTRTQLGHEPDLRVVVPLDGKLYRGREVLGLIDRLLAQHQLTTAAATALRWIVEHIEDQGGVLDLRGQRFALLGAGAELAPTRMLLKAGASVLWVDVADPERSLAGDRGLSGTLVRDPAARDLLEAPRAIAAAIARLAAEEGPVHLGMFAYAPGASQEWRLAAAMNAIAIQLDPGCLRSIACLISPTMPASLQPEHVRAARQHLAEASGWKKALQRAGLLPTPGHYEAHGACIARATVSLQGLSYQAAQYVSKLAAAETFAVHGTDPASPTPLTVSANVAGITRTRSLSHPLFEAAFTGAPQLGVRIFDAETTRALSGLLILHDLLNPAAPGAATAAAPSAQAKAAGLLSQQVHGGVYTLPYVLEQAIRVAAAIGVGMRPTLLLGRPPKSREATVPA